MKWFLRLLFLYRLSDAYCHWYMPSEMFPETLLTLHMPSDRFTPRHGSRRRLLAPLGMPFRVEIHESSARRRLRRVAHYVGGLDDTGRIWYGIDFDGGQAKPGLNYEILKISPDIFDYDASLVQHDDARTSVIKVMHVSELSFQDIIEIEVGARSDCAPERLLSSATYHFNVTAYYDLYHSYENKLVPNASKTWTSEGWVSNASIILHPALHMSTQLFHGHTLSTPCIGSKFESSLQSYNTSQYSYWDLETFKWKTPDAFVGTNESIPRCHRREHGNVCSIVAKVRLTYGECPIPVKFSIRQAVSQIAHLSTHSYVTSDKPANFDAHRRLPVPDDFDMRYDMCEARACQDENVCEEIHIENDGLIRDANITIEQHDVHAAAYIETVCRFEVIGFIDDIWTPKIYFRQWVGYNYTW